LATRKHAKSLQWYVEAGGTLYTQIIGHEPSPIIRVPYVYAKNKDMQDNTCDRIPITRLDVLHDKDGENVNLQNIMEEIIVEDIFPEAQEENEEDFQEIPSETVKYNWEEGGCILCHYGICKKELHVELSDRDCNNIEKEKQNLDDFAKIFHSVKKPTLQSKFKKCDTIDFTSLLRIFMVKNAITERIMKNLLKLLQLIHDNNMLDDPIPTLYQIKRVDSDFTNRIPIEEFTIKSESEEIFNVYYLNPISIIEEVFTKEHNITDNSFTLRECANHCDIYSSVFSSDNFRNAFNKFEEVYDFNFDQNAELNNIFVPISFFIDAFNHSNFSNSINCYYLTIYISDDRQISTPFTIDPPNYTEASDEIFEKLVCTTVNILQNGYITLQYKYNRKVRIFGYLHCLIGDDIGFRKIFNFTSTSSLYPNRYYLRHRKNFSNVKQIDKDFVSKIQSYKKDYRKNSTDIINVYNLYFKYQENPFYYSSMIKLIKLYSIRRKSIVLSAFFKLDQHIYDDFANYSPVCELHMIRLGIIKNVLYLFGQTYGEEYKKFWNATTLRKFHKKMYIKKENEINRKVHAKNILQIICDASKIHVDALQFNGIIMNNKSETSILHQLNELTMLRNKSEWNEQELVQLQLTIIKLKENLISVFGNQILTPNFESLDMLPLCIQQCGMILNFSTEKFESLHKQVKLYLNQAKKNNIHKNFLFHVQRHLSYSLCGWINILDE